MPGIVIENLSGKRLSVLVTILLLFQLACFLVGLMTPNPTHHSQSILATICMDEEPKSPTTNRWFTKSCSPKIDIQQETTMNVTNGNNLVFVVELPNFFDFSRWQQNLVAGLEVDFIHIKGQQILDPIMEFTLNVQLAYKDKFDNEYKYYAHSEEKRYIDCNIPKGNTYELDAYMYMCSTVPLFELGNLHYDHYLLNMRLPYDSKSKNIIGRMRDIFIHITFMNGGFTKAWMGLKTLLFPVLLFTMAWYWRRVKTLNRTPALLEYTLMCLAGSLLFLDLPLEYLTLYFNMPYMLILGDIRQGIFYAMLLSFWLIFTGEHMIVENNGEKNSLKMYWKPLSTIITGCFCLLVFDLCEHGIQLINPFYSIWVTPTGTNLALTFMVLAGLCASMYFIFLCYKTWKVFKNKRLKCSVLPSMSVNHRLHYEGLIFRFNFLMLTTVICAAITVISFILGQVSEGQNKWNLLSVMHTGVYSMWNVYICTMLILHVPSHKR